MNLIEAVHQSEICKGNYEDKYTSLPTIHGEVLMNQSSKLMYLCKDISVICYSKQKLKLLAP